MFELYNNFKTLINISILKNDQNMKFILDLIYEEETNKKTIYEIINHYSLYMIDKNAYSEFYLGLMYTECIFLKKDILQSFKFFFHSANQNFFSK